jgi:hypothetical protein
MMKSPMPYSHVASLCHVDSDVDDDFDPVDPVDPHDYLNPIQG